MTIPVFFSNSAMCRAVCLRQYFLTSDLQTTCP